MDNLEPLPDARLDGRCVDCEKRVDTYGQKLCLDCALARIKELSRASRPPRDLNRRGTEQTGRPQRHWTEYGDVTEYRDGVPINEFPWRDEDK